jgi:hypothetical protein
MPSPTIRRMRTMATRDENAEVAWLERLASRRKARLAAARSGLALRYQEVTRHVAALEEALDELRSPYHRYRITRWIELVCLAVLCTAEIVVADTVVQALGLTAITTGLVAVVVGGAATGLAWLLGHEWAVSRDPHAAAAGRRGWLRLTVITVGLFLVINLGVRIYYGVLDEQAAGLGDGLIAPVLSGFLLTIVTMALILIAAFITAHSETAEEAQLRARLKRLRTELRSLEDRVGVLQPGTVSADRKAIGEEGDSPEGLAPSA